ncbi:PHP domain-containing protein [Tenggerimyces flavus]|uniref:PHP domain-containing protein n=1 Tax=Tenggerimyces flavus TaxID=1708749 RepID=A0ABV7YBT8_9ACTN|nr:PHP domain-containing protein [Tenggerimyces flavus]MBM7788959.1 putative hydrolase [Tenggerimyces flavus]
MNDVLPPIRQLQRIGFLLERKREETHRVRAFRKAAWALQKLSPKELDAHVAAGSLTDVPDVGKTTAKVVMEAAEGRTADYLAKLESVVGPLVAGGDALRSMLRGDLHTHSEWSDGGSPIEEMAETAIELGHDYMALTDHSPRLKVANGLSIERLREQLDVVKRVNAELAPFRILTGIEVDILEDGRLDQSPEILAELDLVVASVHSKLRMESDEMTRRMVIAIANPNVDVLGHCTGRLITGGRGTRPESTFDAEIVFEACRRFDVAVEINSRPERLDPPKRLLRLAEEMGCVFSLDTDAHAPGQLDWQPYGCLRAEECGVPGDRIVNTMELDDLLAWTEQHSVD